MSTTLSGFAPELSGIEGHGASGCRNSSLSLSLSLSLCSSYVKASSETGPSFVGKSAVDDVDRELVNSLLSGLSQGVPDGPCEMALQATQRLHPRLPLSLLFGEEPLRRLMSAPLVDRDPVQRAVELAVAAAIEAMALRLRPEEAGIGATPASRASLASEPKRSTPAVSARILAALRGPQPTSSQQLGRLDCDQRRDLALELGRPTGALANRPHQITGDPHPSALLGAGELAGDPIQPDDAIERTHRHLELRPEVVQVPAQALLVL